MTPVTCRIRALAARIFGGSTMERLIDPILGDIELEYLAHLNAGRLWRSRWVAISGCCGLVRAIVLQMLDATRVALVDEAAKRTMWVSLAAFTAITVALTLPPLLSAPLFARDPSLAVYLVPQAIPFSIPIALSIGIVWAWSSRTDGRAMLRRVVVLGTAGVLISLATMEWLVPAANDGFRVTLTRVLAPAGITPTISRGIGDRSLSELAALIRPTSQMSPFEVTEYESVLRDLHGIATPRGRRLESLKLALQVRVALAFAALALAILAVATAAAIRRRNLARMLFAGFVLLYVLLWFGAAAIAPAVPPLVSAWLPNAAVTAIALVFCGFSVRRPRTNNAVLLD